MKWHLQKLRYAGHIGNIDSHRKVHPIVLGIVLSRREVRLANLITVSISRRIGRLRTSVE